MAQAKRESLSHGGEILRAVGVVQDINEDFESPELEGEDTVDGALTALEIEGFERVRGPMAVTLKITAYCA